MLRDTPSGVTSHSEIPGRPFEALQRDIAGHAVQDVPSVPASATPEEAPEPATAPPPPPASTARKPRRKRGTK